MAHDDVEAAVLASVPEGVTHIGFVAFDLRNQVLVLQPKEHVYGVSATLPRVRVKPDEPPAMTLDRCLNEKLGWGTTSAFPLHTVWVTENSSSFYLTGMIKDNDEPAQGEPPPSSWCSLDVARSILQKS